MPGLAVETSFDLRFIWLYYFYLVHIIYYFYLTKMNLFIYFYIPTKFMINKKKILSSDLCIFSCSDIFVFQDGVFHCFTECNKKTCHQPFWGLLVNSSLISQFWENVISFNILGNALTPSHCSYNNEKAVFVQESKSNFFIVLFFKFIFINFLL